MTGKIRNVAAGPLARETEELQGEDEAVVSMPREAAPNPGYCVIVASEALALLRCRVLTPFWDVLCLKPVDARPACWMQRRWGFPSGCRIWRGTSRGGQGGACRGGVWHPAR